MVRGAASGQTLPAPSDVAIVSDLLHAPHAWVGHGSNLFNFNQPLISSIHKRRYNLDEKAHKLPTMMLYYKYN